MRHTLKAVFAHRSDAQHVLDELLASGYSPADTALSNELPTTQDDAGLDGEDAKAGGPVKRLAARLFHTGQREHSAAYSDAFLRGRHVVTLTADSEPDIARAVAIIERFGPLGIETHDDDWTIAASALDEVPAGWLAPTRPVPSQAPCRAAPMKTVATSAPSVPMRRRPATPSRK